VYAIIRTGGRQYRVQQGDTIYIDRVQAPEGEKITLGEVLMVAGEGDAQVGSPLVKAASVTGTVLEQGRDHKIRVFKYKAKKGYRKRAGHRSELTRLEVTEVKLVATMLLQRLRVELLPGRSVTIRQMPTLSPRGGLQMRVRERALPDPLG